MSVHVNKQRPVRYAEALCLTRLFPGLILTLLFGIQIARADGISFVIYFNEDCAKGIYGAGRDKDLICNVVGGPPTLTYNPAAEAGNNYITPGDVILTEPGVDSSDPNLNSDILRFALLAPNDPKGARKLLFLSDGEQELFGTIGAPKVIPEVDLTNLKPIATSGGVVGPFDGTNKKFPDLRGTMGAYYVAGVG